MTALVATHAVNARHIHACMREGWRRHKTSNKRNAKTKFGIPIPWSLDASVVWPTINKQSVQITSRVMNKSVRGAKPKKMNRP
mmetsp:Transcript_53960/g.137041  ORF Transcript_53960/g.137041 Transcript_53960/m.137041 type:complete len:83 (+) Transcript_53960:687-935(+)